MYTLVLVLVACIAVPALAQDAPFVGTSLDKDQLSPRLNLDVPSSVGFAILGVSPDNVITPRKGSEFAIGILNGLDQQGNFQTGLAFEANPYFWTLPDKVQLDKYLNDRKYRLWSGFSFTLATSSGQQDADQADRIGVGVNFAYDFNDPLFSRPLTDCIFDVQGDILDEYSQERVKISTTRTVISRNASDAEKKAADATIRAAEENLINRFQTKGGKSVDTCYKDNVGWNKTIIQLGIAVHNSELGGVNPIDESGQSAWVSYSHGLGKYYQVTIHGSYDDDLLVFSNDALVVTDRSFAGARIRVGSSKIRAFIEAGITDEEMEPESDTFWNAALGAEFHITSTLFLQLAYGDTFGSSGDKKEYLSGQFKWAVSPTSAFGSN